MHTRTAFPYETTHEDLWIPLADGTRLYARMWRPLTGEPVPALLEYLPDRLSDATAPRDAQRHPWYAGHGYASVRVDVRGHGNSEGVPADAETTEPADGVEVVHWLAAQPWCSGRVGMFGLSRGGVTALRIAALAPEPLGALVTVCSDDDRFDHGIEHGIEHGIDGAGGAVPTTGAHARAAAALAHVARPPDPAYVGQVMWRDMWVKRLETVDPFIRTWPSHPAQDPYGSNGGAHEDGSVIRAAVLAVGGWHDPYRDSVLRLVQSLPPDRVRGVIGPWSHAYPDQDRPPGPAIGFLQETLRWWDHWLKPHGTRTSAGTDAGSSTGTDSRTVMSEPLLRAYVMDAHPPATTYASLPGRWVGDGAWPSPSVTPVAYALRGAPVLVRSPQHTGVDAGRFRPTGGDADLPPDQREEDARSACFEFEVPGETWILGRPSVRLRMTSHSARGQVIARVCDVAPDGASTLVTRGALNVPVRDGGDQAASWRPGTTEDVRFDLDAIGYAVPPGHRIRLSLSSAYWPWMWPEPGSEAGFTLDPSGSSLELPVRARQSDPTITFAEPEHSVPLGVASAATLDEPRPERLVVRDMAKGEWRLEVVPRHCGTRVHPDGLEHTEDALETYSVQEAGPLSARAHFSWSIRLHRPEPAWDARIEVRSEVTCDTRDFITSSELVCKDGDEVVFHRTWERRIPRTTGQGPGGAIGDPAERSADR
ncbi:CocE/NonD family hydrolase [Streptomyces sp. NBC_01571]|uniref:CocE/NonD family hydrolase n=1 Tax=Streptomyces sp. NBC_01571 TaxID=2975883 RepID=UPI00225A71C7|nr:CocE/NonD family hydrolase [Streptomyces sp. NBC_01571]MCX4576786.1 CocE/NonD family hydrolase [Streptomyces sp. NBC_01571]